MVDDDIWLKTGHAIKIFQAKDGTLLGASGNCDYCCDFINWGLGDREGPAPKQAKIDSSILITPNGKIHCYYGKVKEEMLDEYVAIGAGAPIALGAFFMGASAEEAAQAAIKFSMACGGEVTTLSLTKKRK